MSGKKQKKQRERQVGKKEKSQPRLRPFFSYYGSKWRAAPKYPAPVEDTIIEPFAGSAAYALLYYDRKVILNDLNPTIAALWRYLVNPKTTRDTILKIPLAQMGPKEKEKLAKKTRKLGEIQCPEERAALRVEIADFRFKFAEDELNKVECPEERTLIGFWWGKALVEPAKIPTGWLIENEPLYNVQYWGESRRQRVADQIDKIKHWKILGKSYENLGNPKATWFIDPPYKNKAGEAYTCGPDDIDYKHLGEWCKTRNGQVIICENLGADWLPPNGRTSTLGSFKTARSGKSIEIYWTKS